MNRTDTILALERKRLRIVNRWAALRPGTGMTTAYMQASDRMMRLTTAIDGAIQRLGKL